MPHKISPAKFYPYSCPRLARRDSLFPPFASGPSAHCFAVLPDCNHNKSVRGSSAPSVTAFPV
jgi:hypothetical protein